MNRVACLASLGLLVLSACSDPKGDPFAPSFAASAGTTARVTSDADDGPGSFREAIADANADPGITLIQFAQGAGAVALESPIVFTGSQPLTIRGGELDGSGLGAGEPAFTATGGGSLTVVDLTVRDAPGNGIVVDVPDAATGTLTFVFDRVSIRDNGFFGVLINDQAEFFDDPASVSPEGSAASVVVRVTQSLIEGNGLGALDNDGFRINEGGIGSIDATVLGTVFVGNGADGLELDERASGDAIFTIQHSSLTDNGAFDVATDPDDGIDVDEAGDGDVIGRFVHVIASDNSEQGVDLNENDAGDMRIVMNQVEATGNGQEGIEFEEDDDFAGGGDIDAQLSNVTTNGNGLAADGDAGLKLREKGEGNLLARVVRAWSSNNINGVGGILFREDMGGDMDVEVVQAKANTNHGDGVRFQGTGVARLQRVGASGNAGQEIRTDAVILTQVPPGF